MNAPTQTHAQVEVTESPCGCVIKIEKGTFRLIERKMCPRCVREEYCRNESQGGWPCGLSDCRVCYGDRTYRGEAGR
jgi:hypothetical protein